jgi:ABC-2 type transport system permease protein
VSGPYVDYLVPGIILMTASSTAEATAVNICTDMAEGIIAASARWPSPARRC